MENKSKEKTIDSEKSNSVSAVTPVTSVDDPRKIHQEVEKALVEKANLTDDEQRSIQERLYKMIDYTVKRQDWYADQCHRLLQIGLGLIASSAAIIALFTKVEKLSVVSQFLAYSLGVSIFFTGIRLVYLYNIALAGDHPYRKLANITSWFFAYRFPEDLPQNISKNTEIARKQIEQESKYIREYFSNFLSHAKDKLGIIREDIEQVSVLLILQKYKHKQTQQMSRNLSNGLWVTTVILALFFLSLVFFPNRVSIPISSTPTVVASATISATPTTSLTPTNVPPSASPTLAPKTTSTP